MESLYHCKRRLLHNGEVFLCLGKALARTYCPFIAVVKKTFRYPNVFFYNRLYRNSLFRNFIMESGITGCFLRLRDEKMKRVFTDKSFLIFTGIALLSGYGCYAKGGSDTVIKGLKAAWAMMVLVGPRLLAAFILAGFVQVLLPKNLIIKWVGAESGMRGILIASSVGVITPGGPMVSFPLVAALFKLGAGYGPLVAYLTSWSVLSFFRMAVWEIPFMGLKFTALRFFVSLILPIVAGLSAQKVSRFFEDSLAEDKE
jgi:uncharacterized membrane protein YraQ (UPF0718 family)